MAVWVYMHILWISFVCADHFAGFHSVPDFQMNVDGRWPGLIDEPLGLTAPNRTLHKSHNNRISNCVNFKR